MSAAFFLMWNDDWTGTHCVPAFDRLAPSRQKENIRAVDEAKKPETPANRIQALIDARSS